MMRTLLALLAGLAVARACLFPARPLKDSLDPERLPRSLYLVLEVADYGSMALRLFTRDAPYNSANVANLAIKGFYDGLTFHRIIPGFVVQGGDPAGDGTGGPGYDVRAEIRRLHTKGAIAMARTGDEINPERKSSGSQFYLCLEPLPRLDGSYTVIGEMAWGFDVLQRLGSVPTGDMDRPLRPVVIQRAWVTTRRPTPPRE